ncbi:MAG: UbiA family prenyltransferase [Candidatus Eremiobacteraeota bacterium]|nr:UbiA family prenyltransferase [Candidatus Eremiobacteraeota bacterium]MBV9263477.1 UbiA family prenyltransferase [Candidatus Eremiobacteraeota bacterium]
MNSLRIFLREIRVEHTLFALPFAYVGAILAARGIPSLPTLGWITLAVLGARTAAMAANRFLDREIDARNPRTARRAVASGVLAPSIMVWATLGGLALLAWAALELNPLCFELLPIAVVLLLVYPLCKRFTWMGHFVLGAVDGLAPLGAYVAVAGKITLPALLLFIAVTLWVAGFDIIYALMDLRVDREQGIASLPVRFGERSGRTLPFALHLAMLLLLAGAGVLDAAGSMYYLGVAAVGVLILYERYLFGTGANLFVINERVFVSNMIFSICFLLTTVGGYR